MVRNDFPYAWISYLALLLAQPRYRPVIPTSSFQSLSPGCFSLPSLKTRTKRSLEQLGFARVSFSHTQAFAITSSHTHTHHRAWMHTLPGCISIPLPRTRRRCLAHHCLSNICLSGVFLLMQWLVRKRSCLLATLSAKDICTLKKKKIKN